MPDFSKLLKRPAGVAKRQPPFPAFDYPAIVKSYEYNESAQRKTPYVRYHFGLTGWPENLPDDAKLDNDGNEMDPSKKSFRCDFYLTDDALIMLDDFIRSCGVDPEGQDYETVIPSLIGCACTVRVEQRMNETTNEIYNPAQVRSVRGTANV